MGKINKRFIALVMALASVSMAACGGNDELPDNVVADKYKITVACQTEMGEEKVLKTLKAAYEAKNADVVVDVKTFSGDSFEQYMLGIAAQQDSSPNIIWTADTYHSQWDEYFTDLRPYYEASAETDYSLYYETMLDAAATNGRFKPTKNYKGEFRSDDLDTADGYESYKNHSQYGLYYAPRDYNKPAILCNTHLFAELDTEYEKVYKAVQGVAEMPTDYQSASARLQAIVNGKNWETMNDLYTFIRFVAEKMAYIVNNSETVDRNLGRKWKNRAALNLFLEWEPTYTTVLNDLGVDLIADDGSLNFSTENAAKLESVHSALFPADEGDNQLASLMTTTSDGVEFSSGNLLMTVCSRPVVLGYGETFKGSYGTTSLETIRFPVAEIAAGNSGYAISNIWDGKGMTVNGVYKSYTDLSWDFIKFIISEEGQEIAGATGLNIPVLKKLYSEETNGGVTPAWRKVESLGTMDNDAWVAGGELRQDTYNIFKPQKRSAFRATIRTFFGNLQRSNYNDGSLTELINTTVKNYNLQNPGQNLL